jgi:hypothetical protein
MNVLERIGRHAVGGRSSPLARRLLARPYGRGDAPRYAVIYETTRISYSQVFPFVRHAADIERGHGVQLRFYSVEAAQRMDFGQVDYVLMQLWFTREHAVFERLFERIHRGGARVVAFLDSFAHNDLRLAPILDAHIDFYLKKSLFRDRGQYHARTLGHTNLTDFYSRAHGIADTETQWEIPDGFLDKLRLSPNFFTAPDLYRRFLDRDADSLRAGARDIDVHARLGRRGSGWYSAMRTDALEAVSGLSGRRIASDGIVDKRRYNAELERSKICFSPFGYGELCWRDIEAMAFGAVLLKPDMDHLDVLPEIYEPGVTYIPVKWDFSDVADKVDWIIANPQDAAEIARTAFLRIRSYLEEARFSEDMRFLFEPHATRR